MQAEPDDGQQPHATRTGLWVLRSMIHDITSDRSTKTRYDGSRCFLIKVSTVNRRWILDINGRSSSEFFKTPEHS